MKAFRNIIIGLILLFTLVYLGQTYKATRVKAVRLSEKLEEGKITREEYEKEIQQTSFGKILLDPGYVFSID